MIIPVLKFLSRDDGYELLYGDWDTEDIAGCMGRDRYDRPQVYMVARANLPLLTDQSDAVADRGIKDPRKGLAHYLLGRKTEKIPVIDGHYENDRQVIRSIRTLVEKAFEKGENRLFVVGTPDSVFEMIRKGAHLLSSKSSSTQQAARKDSRLDHQMGEISLEKMMQLLESRHDLELTEGKGLSGESIQVKFINLLIAHAAQVDYPVMILGPSGSGKEIVAREIHQAGKGSQKPFVAVNCSAISDTLFESELFGYKRGSFTGAKTDRDGLWKTAEDGTLFLDEIGDLNLENQAKILRALQNRSIRPVGAVRDEMVNARIITATNRDLSSMKKDRQFREDLFYRLHCFIIRTPALTGIFQDIPVIAHNLWRRVINDEQAFLPQAVLEELQRYHWPGNVRELKMFLSQMNALFGKTDLSPLHVKAVFSLQRQLYDDERSIFRLARILDHLNSVEETLQTIKAQFLALSEGDYYSGPDTIEDSLRMQLGELDLLCRTTGLFGNEDAFFAVHQLYGKLLFFVEGIPNESKKNRKAKDGALQGEIDRVLKQLEVTAENLKNEAGSDAGISNPVS